MDGVFRFSQRCLTRIRGSNQGRTPTTTDPVADPVTDPVTDPVDQVLQALTDGPLAPIRVRLRVRHRPTFRANYLHPALA